MTVHKYPVQVTDVFNLKMPRGAKLLTVQVHRGEPRLWALVNPEAEPVFRHFRLAGTGHPMGDHTYDYVGTFQLEGGALVFHLFEIL